MARGRQQTIGSALASLTLIASALLAPAIARAGEAEVRPLETDAENVKSQVAVIKTDLDRATAKEKRYPIEQGFLEAQMAYERGNLAMASVRLMDLVHNGDFQQRRD
jgi:hypothetical protein